MGAVAALMRQQPRFLAYDARDPVEDAVELRDRPEPSREIAPEAFILTAVSPASIWPWIASAIPLGLSPPTHPYILMRSDAFANRAAEQIVDRDSERLAFDLPQRLVDARDGPPERGTTAVKADLGKQLPMVLDAPLVRADEVFGKLLDDHAHRIGVSLEARFSSADYACVRLDPDEQPPRWHQERLDSSDAHRRRPSRRGWSG